jgi:hypothetical protein
MTKRKPSQWSKGARKTIPGPFVPRLLEMIERPPYRVLSLSAHRLLARLEIEHCHHGGTTNGKLVVTFDQFRNYGGMDRHAIAPALREVIALGFVEKIKGAGGNADLRAPNQYRLTY